MFIKLLKWVNTLIPPENTPNMKHQPCLLRVLPTTVSLAIIQSSTRSRESECDTTLEKESEASNV